mmetsp:Transcript_18878/g.26391  ORF Transcript_18878/g.26391 Transcript_18878/m.26391 type:complete len:135 (+) Transcript_18878:95-499(+)
MFGSDTDSGSSLGIKGLIGLAFAVTVGLVLVIIACVVWQNGWPIIVVIAYFVAPIPNMIFGKCTSDPLETDSGWKGVGYFLTGVCIVSGFALPLVLAHVDVINFRALLLSLAGGIIVYVAMLVFLHKFLPKSEY